MLRVYCGTDQIKVREKAHAALAEILSPEETFTRIEGDTYEAGLLAALSSTASLFSPRSVYLLETPLQDDIFAEDFMGTLEGLGKSLHTFIVIEQVLTAADKKSISKYASVVEEYKKPAGDFFNPFQLAEALSLKDKRSLWMLLQEAKRNGSQAEELIGMLWWQLKAIRLAAATQTFEEAGMKEYLYKKAKNALRVFPLELVEDKSRTLLTLYHEGHRGKRDIDIALEEWVLTL